VSVRVRPPAISLKILLFYFFSRYVHFPQEEKAIPRFFGDVSMQKYLATGKCVKNSFFLICFCLLFSGCAKERAPTDAPIQEQIEKRLGKSVNWHRIHQDGRVKEKIAELKKAPLTCHTAVEIALLNNPKIQAEFEELGIAEQDLIEAGLFQNPMFEGFVRFPNQESLHVNTEFSIAQSFLDLILIPLRKKVAEAEYEEAKLKVTKSIVDLAFEVQKTFFALVSKKKKAHLFNQLIEIEKTSCELALEQKKHGNISDLEFQKRTKEFIEKSLETSKIALEISQLEELLTAQLGFLHSHDLPQISEELQEAPVEINERIVEDIALTKRLDLEIARWKVERIARLGATKKWWAYTKPTIGLSTEREPEGEQVTGLTFSTELPIFNYGQTERERLIALYKQSQEELKALTLQALCEVRTATHQIALKKELLLQYKNSLLPLEKKIISSSEKFYNIMALGPYDLLEAKKEELLTQIAYTEMLTSYWISVVELDHTLDGHLLLIKPDRVALLSSSFKYVVR
jgi:outer membrane protein, heavy metal efflux system